MYRLPDELVASVRFVRALNPYKIGDIVAGDEYRTWPEANRRAIVDQGFIELIGGQPEAGAAALDRGDLVRVVVPRKDSLFDVVEGRKINETPLTDEAATALADEVPEPVEDHAPRLIEADHDPAPEPAVDLPERPEDAIENEPATESPSPRKRTGGGRPKGSKNKPKKPKPARRQIKAPVPDAVAAE